MRLGSLVGVRYECGLKKSGRKGRVVLRVCPVIPAVCKSFYVQVVLKDEMYVKKRRRSKRERKKRKTDDGTGKKRQGKNKGGLMGKGKERRIRKKRHTKRSLNK
jgi:hypothetical protein